VLVLANLELIFVHSLVWIFIGLFMWVRYCWISLEFIVRIYFIVD
jgi:hypothetical protein